MIDSSGHQIKNICVFGGFSHGKERVFRINKSSWLCTEHSPETYRFVKC
jgi:hypothetical protein